MLSQAVLSCTVRSGDTTPSARSITGKEEYYVYNNDSTAQTHRSNSGYTFAPNHDRSTDRHSTLWLYTGPTSHDPRFLHTRRWRLEITSQLSGGRQWLR